MVTIIIAVTVALLLAGTGLVLIRLALKEYNRLPPPRLTAEDLMRSRLEKERQARDGHDQ